MNQQYLTKGSLMIQTGKLLLMRVQAQLLMIARFQGN
jgi:hypothetical protein